MHDNALAPYITQLKSIEMEYKEAALKYPKYRLNYRDEANALIREFVRIDGLQLQIPKSALSTALMLAVRLGISVCPLKKQCYLAVTYLENGMATVDLAIGYRGYEAIFCGSGLLTRIDVGLVYSKDNFTYQGPRQEVIHTSSTLSTEVNKRGRLECAYCMAELSDGSIMTSTMSIDELNAVEAMAREYGHSSSWDSAFSNECRRAAIIRYSAKDWFRIAEHHDCDTLPIKELEENESAREYL